MNDYRSLEQKIRQVVYEAEQNRNTEAREKVANVGRPTDNVKGVSSKQAKQGEIVTKIIDEAGPQTQPLEPKTETKDKKPAKDKDTVDAKKITGGKTEVDLNPTTDDRTDDGKKLDDNAKKATKKANREGGVQEETHMFKSDTNFGLPADLIEKVKAAMGKCPKCGKNPCQCSGDPKEVEEALKGGQKKLDKNHNGKLDKQDFKMLRKEEIESIDELSKDTLKSYVGAVNKGGLAKDTSKKMEEQAEITESWKQVHMAKPKGHMEKGDIHHVEVHPDTLKKHGISHQTQHTSEYGQTHHFSHPKHGTVSVYQRDLNKDTGHPVMSVRTYGGDKSVAHHFAKKLGATKQNEEVEQIDEISDKTLTSYMTKSARSGAAAGFRAKAADLEDDSAEKKKQKDIQKKRETGYGRAISRAHARMGHDPAKTLEKKYSHKVPKSYHKEEIEPVDEMQHVWGSGGNKKNLKIIKNGVVVKDYGTETKPNKKTQEKLIAKAKAVKEETDLGFSEAEIARIEEIAKGL